MIAPLSLLLSQAHAYEVTLADNLQARLVASVLSSLAQRVVQQVRDLEADLYPRLLERLGLEAALEAYAGQIQRANGRAARFASGPPAGAAALSAGAGPLPAGPGRDGAGHPRRRGDAPDDHARSGPGDACP